MFSNPRRGKRLRKLAAGILLITLLVPTFHQTASANTNTHIAINGKELISDLAPISKNGSIFVPMRLIFESLHAKVTYLPSEKKVLGEKGSVTIELQIGMTTAHKNNQSIPLSTAPFIEKNSVYVPIRFIGEALGASVNWNKDTRTVEITNPSVDVTTELPILNDSGKPIMLEHQGNMKLKWSFQDESPYVRYTGFVVPKDQLLFTNSNYAKVMDHAGNVIKEMPLEKNGPLASSAIDAVAVDKGYKVTSKDTTTVWKSIPLYTKLNVVSFVKVDGIPSMDFLHPVASIDKLGNLIIITTEGLAAYDPQGNRLWVHSEWTKGSEKESAFNELLEIHADGANNLYLSYANHLVVLDPKGELIGLLPGRFANIMLLDDGTIIGQGEVYRIVEGEMQQISESQTQSGQMFRVTNGDKTLQKVNPDTGEALWTYQLPKLEESRGYNFFGSTLVHDLYGNVYISTQGGTVHALDAEGNLRFKLVINQRTISSSQVIPLSATEVVVVNENAVAYFEISE
ncbi:stalk domain-containing protein [Paenibacillus kobensis]|uniref:stalk domain-containing protein n=1 Tax=Paenibacillus kobensis TaxID=59841 RepID=UPI0013E3D24A|nr:stalk domain-containing protein [Paenibacillus kobensis]